MDVLNNGFMAWIKNQKSLTLDASAQPDDRRRRGGVPLRRVYGALGSVGVAALSNSAAAGVRHTLWKGKSRRLADKT
jgi:hypothetical protein